MKGQFRGCRVGESLRVTWFLQRQPLHQQHCARSLRLGQALTRGGTPITHRWAGQAGESSLTTLTRQTDDAPLASQTLGTWRTVGTLGEEGQGMRTDTERRTLPHPRSPASSRSVLGAQEPLTTLQPETSAEPGRDLLRDHHHQALPSRQGVLQDPGGQVHRLGRQDQCLLEHLWDRLFQKDPGGQGVQGCPKRSKCRT